MDEYRRFLNSTQKFYLDLEEGDCIIFKNEVLHMSDYRKSKKRHAINFRVVNKKVKDDILFSNKYEIYKKEL